MTIPITPRNPLSNPRSALAERTNVQQHPIFYDASPSIKSWFPPPKGVKCKRKLDTLDRGDRKRVKLSSGECSDGSDAYENSSDTDSEAQMQGHRRKKSVFSTRFTAPAQSFRRPIVSTLPILQSFVSSHKSDVFRCQSVLDGPFLTPPYACSYSHSARSGGTPLLAVATEQGTVHIINTAKRKDWDPAPVHTTLQPHANGIFDVKWNSSDTLLATSSGDKSTRVSDLATSRTIQTLLGHQGTARCVSWDPDHPQLLSTGGRDGRICIWDLRVGEDRAGQESSSLSPVASILSAHENVGPNGKRKAPKGKKAPVPKTVTGLLYSDAKPYQLISTGSSDGILRCWDLRLSTSKVKEPALLHSSPFDPTSLHDSRRPRGIISLARGTGPTAGVIFALGTDSLIHAYARDSLRPYGTSYTHSNLQTNFYVGLACSPCGRFLASGGAGAKGSSFLFDVGNTTHGPHSTSVGVELKGQSGDAGAVDWADSGTLSTCWDDGTVRVWRPEVDTYSACMEQPEEKRWDWCWASAI